MSKININGVEFELDMQDLDQAETVMAAVEKARKDVMLAKTQREQFAVVEACVDTVFGDGALMEITGGKTHIGLAFDAFGVLIAAANEQQNAFAKKVNGMVEKYGGNREQRRAAVKARNAK